MSGRYALPAEPRDPYLGTGLWSRRDLLALVVLYVVGAGGLVFGWYGSAAEAERQKRTPAGAWPCGSFSR